MFTCVQEPGTARPQSLQGRSETGGSARVPWRSLREAWASQTDDFAAMDSPEQISISLVKHQCVTGFQPVILKIYTRPGTRFLS